jgi:hypothetical protein
MNSSTRAFRSGGLGLLAAALLTSMVASGSPLLGPLTGTFGIAGPGVLAFSTNPGISDFIRFCTDADPTCSAAATATGDFDVSGPGSGSFAGLAGTNVGTIDNVTDHTPPVSPYTYLPVGVPVSIDNIITLTGVSSLFNADFQANMLPLATCPTPSASQQCLGPFQLNQNGGNVAVVMDILGTLINLTDGSRSNLDITVTGQYNNTTIGAVETAAESTGGAFSNSWSATVTATAIPEPGTSAMMLLAGGGLLLLSRIRGGRKP